MRARDVRLIRMLCVPEPGKVTDLTASEHTTSSMMLNWTAPQGGVSTYRIKAMNDSQEYVSVDTCGLSL